MKKISLIVAVLLALGTCPLEAKNSHGGGPGNGGSQQHQQGPQGNRGGQQGRPGNGNHGRPGNGNPGNHYGHRPQQPRPPMTMHPQRPAPARRFVTTPPPRPVRYVSAVPSLGLSVSLGPLTLWFGGSNYYEQVGPGRWQIVNPPIGMLVPALYDAWSYVSGGVTYYVSNGIVYNYVFSPQGWMYQVVGYQ